MSVDFSLNMSSSGRRSSSDPTSPEFEFWMVRNPSFPQPNLLSADQLFADGVLLPLDLLPQQTSADPPDLNADVESEPPASRPAIPEAEACPGPELTTVIPELTTGLTASKRWKDIFLKSEKKNGSSNLEEREKGKKKERNKSGSASGSGSAELNINIWPFSRSRSAGNAGTGTRPRIFSGAPGSRKVNSAPCSRSNSAGESKSRKWPSSPGRPGVHLGRTSPVWQVRRGGAGGRSTETAIRNSDKGSKKEASSESRRSKSKAAVGSTPKARVLNLNVPMCIGYRHHLSCRSDENGAIGVGSGGSGNRSSGTGDAGGGGGNVSNGGSLFNLRNLFTKKVY